ncbi:MAG: hypothetical protein L3J20_10745 [Flavobacteriaceae bacterium]|nr:hypothetical protein [Flavobacteriaceae bacterium]
MSQLIDKGNKKDTKVSEKGIFWHLDHSLIIIINVSKMLKKSDPSDYKSTFNFTRSLIFTLNFIPRGKGKSPRSVHPTNDITKEELLKQFEEAKQQINNIEHLPAKSSFKHPLFGVLNLKQTLKFLKIHTNHHLKICKDI